MTGESSVRPPQKRTWFKHVPANVVVLGMVSFLTDVAGDMVYPLLPVFLVQYLGAGEMFVGLVEGVAESTAAIFKLVSGVWADRARDRSKLVLFGYSLSSLSRPFLAIAWHPWVVLAVRFSDRIGKGIRTSPRDAIIADSVESSQRGRAYGLHRAFDHAGAVTGPLLATFLLTFFIEDLRKLFWIAAIPGFLAVALIAWKVREVAVRAPHPAQAGWLPALPKGRLRVFLGILFVFVLSCSSDAFLLLRAKELGVPTPLLPMIWILMNGVMMLTAMPFGVLSDWLGRRRVILLGWLVYTLVYVGFAFASQAWHAWALFACYGLFYSFTEPSELAILADYSASQDRGKSFGWYHFIVGAGTLPASLIFGSIWQAAGSRNAFLISAAISTAACAMMMVFLAAAKPAAKSA